MFCHGGGSLTAGRRVMPALAGVFVTFASTASTAHRTHVMDCYASHSLQVLILFSGAHLQVCRRPHRTSWPCPWRASASPRRPSRSLIEPSESNEHWWVTRLSGAASFAIPHWCERITLCCVRTNRHAWVAARVMVASETAVQERAMLHGSDRGARFTLIEKVANSHGTPRRVDGPKS